MKLLRIQPAAIDDAAAAAEWYEAQRPGLGAEFILQLDAAIERAARASASERAAWEICGGGYGIHWPEIDEDLSTEGLLRGAPAPRHG